MKLDTCGKNHIQLKEVRFGVLEESSQTGTQIIGLYEKLGSGDGYTTPGKCILA
jgi:hypothetical protein